jgi:hypothetical protein
MEEADERWEEFNGAETQRIRSLARLELAGRGCRVGKLVAVESEIAESQSGIRHR